MSGFTFTSEAELAEMRRYDAEWRRVFQEFHGRPYNANDSYRSSNVPGLFADVTAETRRRLGPGPWNAKS